MLKVRTRIVLMQAEKNYQLDVENKSEELKTMISCFLYVSLLNSLLVVRSVLLTRCSYFPHSLLLFLSIRVCLQIGQIRNHLTESHF